MQFEAMPNNGSYRERFVSGELRKMSLGDHFVGHFFMHMCTGAGRFICAQCAQSKCTIQVYEFVHISYTYGYLQRHQNFQYILSDQSVEALLLGPQLHLQFVVESNWHQNWQSANFASEAICAMVAHSIIWGGN